MILGKCPEFRIEILSHSERYIHRLINDDINSSEWLGTFMYGCSHYHLSN